MKNLRLAHLAIGLAVGFAGPAEASAQQIPDEWRGSRPNVVLIMADDLGFSDVGSYGAVEIRTPNIDRLAHGGLRFTHFYNAARCVPTRAALMTGVYPHQAGIGHMIGESRNQLYYGDLRRDVMTIAEALEAAGYANYMAGKWHLTPWEPGARVVNGPRQRGFDRFYGIITSIRSYYNPPSLMEDDRALPAPEGDYHFTDAISDHAARYIAEHDRERPYFLYVAYTAPHWPLHAREADVARYRGKFLEGWDELHRKRHQRLVEMGLIEARWPLPERDPQAVAWSSVDPEYREWLDERMAVYAAMIDQLDRGVGRIVEAIEARGELDNTLILFLSDNGACAEEIGPAGRSRFFPVTTRDGRPIRLGNDPSIDPGPEDTYASYGLEWAWASNSPFRRFKSFAHEGGIVTPFIAHWPGRVRPGITHEAGHVIDMLPTLLELAGGVYPWTYHGTILQRLEGRSLVPVLAGGTRPTAVYGWEHEGNRAVRDGDWKLVSRYPRDWELFNLRDDRFETHDLASEMPGKVAEMKELYREWAERAEVLPWTGPQTPIGWEEPDRYTDAGGFSRP